MTDNKANAPKPMAQEGADDEIREALENQAPKELSKSYNDMSLNQLRDLATEKGFVGSDILTTKAQVVAVIMSMEKKDQEIKAKAAEASAVNFEDPAIDDIRHDEKAYKGKEARMKAFLESQPKVAFMVPLGIGEKPGAIETVQMNGYRLNILKNTMVMLPEPVVKHLSESYRLTALAGQEFSIDRDPTVKDRLT